MLIFNTTYAVSAEDLACFLAWTREQMIPSIHADGALREGRLARILRHDDNDEGYSFSLQFMVDDSEVLHKWYLRQGKDLQAQMNRIFAQRVVGFNTLMEVIE